MPKVHDWEEWDEVEERLQSEQVRNKISYKNKQKRDKKENEKSYKIQDNKKHTN